MNAFAERPLQTIGISDLEERAYRWLILHHESSYQQLGEALSLSPEQTRGLVDELQAKGLVTSTSNEPPRFRPVAPNIALERLVLRKRKDLQDTEAEIRGLQEQLDLTVRQSDDDPIVEVIKNSEAEQQIFGHMHRTAQVEVVTMVRLPMRITRLDVPPEESRKHEREALARGVKYRTLVDAEFLELPGVARGIQDDIRAGEQFRTVKHLPFKMTLADGQTAFLPSNTKLVDSPFLLVHASALLDALYAMFEHIWERASPISFGVDDGLVVSNTSNEGSAGRSMELISLLAAGLNDKSIASELAMSSSTLQRSLNALAKEVGSRSRFQMGWLSALRLSGVIGRPDGNDDSSS